MSVNPLKSSVPSLTSVGLSAGKIRIVQVSKTSLAQRIQRLSRRVDDHAGYIGLGYDLRVAWLAALGEASGRLPLAARAARLHLDSRALQFLWYAGTYPPRR